MSNKFLCVIGFGLAVNASTSGWSKLGAGDLYYALYWVVLERDRVAEHVLY